MALPRARMGKRGEKHLVDAVPVPPHMADFGEGPVPVFPASFFNVGTFVIDGGAETIVMVVGTGRHGVSAALSSTDARTVAEKLIGLADEQQASAAPEASALIERARKGGAA